MTMLPFDLEKAKAGHPLVTRNGLEARFSGFDGYYPQGRYSLVVNVLHKNHGKAENITRLVPIRIHTIFS